MFTKTVIIQLIISAFTSIVLIILSKQHLNSMNQHLAQKSRTVTKEKEKTEREQDVKWESGQGVGVLADKDTGYLRTEKDTQT